MEYLKNLPCKTCISLAICISSYKCECEIVNKYIKDIACDPLYPFHATSLPKYEALLSEARIILRKDWAIRNGSEISFFRNTV
jgi:hypothetical protein